MIKKYELAMIFAPDLTGHEITKKLTEIASVLTGKKDEGKISHEDDWGLLDLAYPIEKHVKGFYRFIYFETDGARIKNIEHTLVMEKAVIRSLIISTPEGYVPMEKPVEKDEEEANKEDTKEEKEKKPSKKKSSDAIEG